MTTINVPYWFLKKEYYYYDENKQKYVLKENAPQKVVDSYNEYYSTQNDNNVKME